MNTFTKLAEIIIADIIEKKEEKCSGCEHFGECIKNFEECNGPE